MKKKLITAAAIIVVFALGAGVGILATGGGYGSQDDPLITRSYLDTVVSAEVKEAFDASASEYGDKLDEKIAEYEKKVDEALDSGYSISDSEMFSVVTLSNGEKVTCGVGTEIMLRIGTAKAMGDDYPALVDITTSNSVYSGTSLVENHMYMVTIKNCGITASSDTVKVLIRGTYTIS